MLLTTALKQLQEHRANLVKNKNRKASPLLKERIEIESKINSVNIKDYVTHLKFYENLDITQVPYIIREEVQAYCLAFSLIVNSGGLEQVMYLLNHGSRLIEKDQSYKLLKDSVEKYFSIFPK